MMCSEWFGKSPEVFRVESGCGDRRLDSRAAGVEVFHTIGVSLTANTGNPIFVQLPLFLPLVRVMRDKLIKWYGVGTALNIGEPLFKQDWTAVIFCRVLIEAKKRFDFELRGLVLDKAWLSFYIKPADGYQLPEIMQWMMDISPLSKRSRSASTS
jgi:hypothetical protein